MTIEQIQELRSDPKALVEKVKAAAPEISEDALNWQPEDHAVSKETTRPKRKIETPTGMVDADGNPTYNTEYQEVNRIPSSTNKDIVNWSVRMSLGVPVQYRATTANAVEEAMLAMVQKTIKDNKMEYIDQDIEEKRLIYGYVFEAWFTEDVAKGYWGELAPNSTKRRRVVVLSQATGDTIVPFFDEYKDLIAVARMFKVKVDGKEVEKMELFMADFKMSYVLGATGWDLDGTPVATISGKIQGVLHESDRMETKDVQPKLNRREQLDSDTADENLASGRPILLATGEIQGVGTRSGTGKVFKVENGGKLEYVEPQGAQESINTERENLIADIHRETATPDPSIFETGNGDVPGISIKLRFTPAINKALSRQQGAIGIAHQRRVNMLKADMAVINKSVVGAIGLDISPVFGIAIPENTTEKYDNVSKLYGAGLLSLKTALNQLGIVDDVDGEMEAILAERKVAAPVPIPVA